MTKQAALADGVVADRHLARRLLHAEADRRLEPLPVGGDEIHGRDGRVADLGGHLGDVVEILLRGRVENLVFFEGLEPVRLLPEGRRRQGFLAAHAYL
jgi:hypothetical protein